jgi:hypothetical protein
MSLVWILLILLPIGLIAVLLVTPIDIKINSDKDEFCSGRYGLIRIGVTTGKEDIVTVIVTAPFLRFTVYPREKTDNRKESGKSVTGRNKRSARSKIDRIKLLINIAWEVICKFKIRRFYLDIDTGNVISNAYLFPLFYMVGNKPRMELNVNYNNNFCLVLDARNNLLNIIIVIIRTLLK